MKVITFILNVTTVDMTMDGEFIGVKLLQN